MNDRDQPHGLHVRQAGTLAVIDAESHTALRGWLITQPLYAAFAWELDGYTPSPALHAAPGHFSTSD